MSHVANDGNPTGGRFTFLGQLGTGATGIVYRVHDASRNEEVALKTLSTLDPSTLYRFKNEFRAISDIKHPNLVDLYELVSTGDEWFVTMELVDGVDFLEWARPQSTTRGGGSHAHASPPPGANARFVIASQTGSTRSSAQPLAAAARNRRARHRRAGALRLDRLRPALLQLARGVSALHEAGRLHRDIKTSNVLVARTGRVVVCDFGLVTELARDSPHLTEATHVVGTLHYMSPEQAALGDLSEASDWYSVGVVLYEALARRLPFQDFGREVVRIKQSQRPTPPVEIEPTTPGDLNDLCMRMLRIRPDERPAGEEILRLLGEESWRRPRARTYRSAPTESTPFVGREAHLDALRAAAANAAEGHLVALHVTGPSGAGKSTLVHRFLDELRSDETTVVLEGRCYESETIPYKAIDPVVDALTRHLVRLPPRVTAQLVPSDIHALSRLFPVLRRIQMISTSQSLSLGANDPQEVRQRAFAELREMLRRLTSVNNLVVSIDALQWGDVDSAALLAEVFCPPDPPPLLLIVSYRSDERQSNPALAKLLRSLESIGTAQQARTVTVENLPQSEALELAIALSARNDGATTELAEAIARDSGGSPLLIRELTHHLNLASMMGDLAATDRRATFREILNMRVAELPSDARALLEVLAVAGRPMTSEQWSNAARLRSDPMAAVATLRAEHFVRVLEHGSRRDLEVLHDSIREAVVDSISDERRRSCHASIAAALQATGTADARALVEHWLAARELEKAGSSAMQAGAHAMENLAFEQAARFLRLAILLVPHPPAEERTLRVALGNALAHAGRGAEAATAYLEAVEGASVAEALELRRRAALEYLRAGYMDEGVSVLKSVLGEVGFSLPPTPRRALLSLLPRRAFLRMRGLRFRRRDPTEIAETQLMRVDLCWSASTGLGMVDTFRGADFQTRQLLLALRSGEPFRVARALTLEACYRALSRHERGRARARKILAVASSLAEQTGDTYLRATIVGAEGLMEYQAGRFHAARHKAEEGARMLRNHGAGSQFELASVELYLLWALFYLGDIREMSRRVHVLLEQARHRGDRYSAANLRTGIPSFVWLAADAPAAARRGIDAAMKGWSRRGFHLQHYWEVFARAQVALYEGQGQTAYELVCSQWGSLRAALFLRIPAVRVEASHLRARCALASVASGQPPKRLLREVERHANRIEREGLPTSAPLALLLRAAVAAARHSREIAVEIYDAAERACKGADLALYATVARHRRGALLGGDEGATLLSESESAMRAEHIRNPIRLIEVLAPSPDNDAQR